VTVALQLLQDYLAQLAAKGVTHVALDEAARRKLAGVAGKGTASVAKAGVTPAGPASGKSSVISQQSAVAPKAAQASVPQKQDVPASRIQHPALDAPAAADKKALLAELAMQAEHCQRARDLGTLRDTMVFATGTPDAEIMFIGEAPGAEEEKQREPFVGPAGQLLTKIIQAMGLRRSDVYISNICKFRPKIEDGKFQGSKNRAPTLGEMLSCQPFILAEINIIKPRIIVALGATASTGLGIEGTVGKLRGSILEWRGTPLVVTYHPSYLLRREQEDGGGLREKRLVWEDMLRVMETIGLPISEKQRGYFLKAVK
jgi:uracil-DNA glycosylase family 4